ncbi:MAG: hypothetical protein F2813_08350 [Actinobacteria bacterium]|uniref:Unannotated protein n=1 Tax=freshwater metagenome TaxID=449393 RepID=A0A6J6A2K4_9ZZZZ|nr:hypothetical protein [Actinomycetota bacterium]
MELPVLYAMRSSLYSAKARSYLVKQRIDYEERPPGDPRFPAEIVPAIGRWIIPVLQTADGRIIQDTCDIIDHFDAEMPPERSAKPPAGVQNIVTRVLEMFGSEGLMRPALHYRWNFDSVNMPFVGEDFGRGLMLPGGSSEESSTFEFGPEMSAGDDVAARAKISEFAADRMRALTVDFGVNPETIPEVERSYLEFLSLLSAHLETAPYLLGGRPTLGDFGLIAPLYAHLSRDPEPSLIMKREAWPVWRWVERMNSPVADCGEYGDVASDLFADGSIPPTLKDLLAYIGREFADEVAAHVGFIDAWLDQNADVGEGDVVGGRPYRRSLGLVTWNWHGHEVTTNAIPYRLLHLQRIQSAFEEADPAAQEEASELLQQAGLGGLLELKARRRVVRSDNRELWGAEQQPVVPA